jgi:sugar/nucleoside kinase (ribokinase family)
MNIWPLTAHMLENGIKTMPQNDWEEAGCDVLVTGRYFCDVVITGLPEMPRLGYEVWGRQCEILPGASFIPAVALHRLGLHVAWPCYFGNDLFSRFVREQARREGLNEAWFLEYDHPALGITISFSFARERAFVSYEDKIPELQYPGLIRQLHPRWIMLMKLWKGDVLEGIIEAARESHTAIFMECQANEESLADPQIVSALKRVDVFSPNLEEALQLTGAPHVDAALAELAALSPLVVVKAGKEGAIAQQGSRIVRVPGIKVDAVETTGAGDNFDCGFIYAQIQGYSLEDSLRCGNICGGLSTEAYGGVTAAPIKEIVEKWRASYQRSGSVSVRKSLLPCIPG